MASQVLTEYERQRLENIRRNDEMMAALKLQSKASELSAASKRRRVETKTYKESSKSKLKNEAPIVLRRSLRARGIPPDAKNTEDGLREPATRIQKSVTKSTPSPHVLGPIEMIEACSEKGYHQSLIESIVSILNESQLMGSMKGEVVQVKGHRIDKGYGSSPNAIETEGKEAGCCLKLEANDNSRNLVETETKELTSGVELESTGHLTTSIKMETKNDGSCLKLGSLDLNPENIARVVPGRIMAVRFFPCPHSRMIVVGNKFGEIGFWNADLGEEEGSGVYLYRPHPGPISGISIQRHALSKVYTSCYDGFIRSMDAEKEMFDLVYYSEDTIYSLSQQSNDVNCLYFATGHGGLNICDERTGNCPMQWMLHEDRINSIDFNVENCNIMATSSSDGTACIWDLRSVNADKPKTLKMLSHRRAIHSAYFSPSGRFLATTSYDDNIGISGGVNFEDTIMISHDNQTGRWISSFRAIWGWDDSYVFIGNMKRAVDVISRAQRKRVYVLQSPHMSAIPCRFDVHPYNVGTLAGATSGGQVYMWTSS